MIMIEINEELKQLIENNIIAFASVDETGKPHNIAVGSSRIISKNQIIVTDNFMKETIQNILKNNNVSLVVWNTDWKDIKDCYGYEFIGTAEYFTSGKCFEIIKNRYKREGKNFRAKGAILITVNKIKKLT